jgi:hypothetical protein
MPRIERITEVVNGNLDLNKLLAKTQEGWKLVALEWHREVALESVEQAPTSRPIEEVPYGLRVAQDCHTLELDPVEHRILLDMMDLMVEDQPFSKIAADLNAKGYRTRKGEVWTMASVFNMLPRLIEIGPRLLSSTEWEQRRPKVARAL